MCVTPEHIVFDVMRKGESAAIMLKELSVNNICGAGSVIWMREHRCKGQKPALWVMEVGPDSGASRSFTPSFVQSAKTIEGLPL
eukprot:6492077-Amphidinium_carterae.3